MRLLLLQLNREDHPMFNYVIQRQEMVGIKATELKTFYCRWDHQIDSRWTLHSVKHPSLELGAAA